MCKKHGNWKQGRESERRPPRLTPPQAQCFSISHWYITADQFVFTWLKPRWVCIYKQRHTRLSRRSLPPFFVLYSRATTNIHIVSSSYFCSLLYIYIICIWYWHPLYCTLAEDNHSLRSRAVETELLRATDDDVRLSRPLTVSPRVADDAFSFEPSLRSLRHSVSSRLCACSLPTRDAAAVATMSISAYSTPPCLGT